MTLEEKAAEMAALLADSPLPEEWKQQLVAAIEHRSADDLDRALYALRVESGQIRRLAEAITQFLHELEEEREEVEHASAALIEDALQRAVRAREE